ncbi:putative NinG protein [Vibrio phage 66E30.1]|nr:putative NinG protein [Vibrio phage 41E34.2]QZI91244.1 NinG protein [Vibrio phage 24E30.2]QZI91284.1 NinG protein [Vibrio phage 24E35.2]QZI91447.1 NinG protein [Vibrio phage 34E29.1]QZI91484.1 NinG protein [Vibrio phage 36E38.1]QZI91753.1 recombination protein [Vibrio phage 44E38.1]QZI91790.1 NinG protein [Vibrio phage 44E38.2]QZI91980.1 NinG protein [Vibrio phage 64E30.1]QZI92019.1 putative NinG protein [Vibrio phage 66E30.1]QZI92104.1 NinG protein [Vibrio phage 75E35.1]
MANSKRKCTHCKDRYPTEQGIKTPAGWFCCIDHAIAHSRKLQERTRTKQANKAKQAQAKEVKASRAASKEVKRRDLKWQHGLTQKSFNKMRVLEEKLWFQERGLEPECISCGRTIGGDQWCCGHFKTRGAQSGLRYDRKNTFLQHNHRCNMNLSGDISGTKTTRGYKQGLIDRFGEDEGQSIIDYCETHYDPVKWTWDELEKMRSSFNKRIRELEVLIATAG